MKVLLVWTRTLTAFLVGLLLGACTATTATAPQTIAQSLSVATLTDETVALLARDDEGHLQPLCSGVWLSSSLIVTADHCLGANALGSTVEYALHDDIGLAGMRSRSAVISARNDRVDLALLRTGQVPSHRSAYVGVGHVGERVHVMGHPLGLYYTYATGVVSALRINDGITLLQTTAPTSPGSSGGGLFNDQGALLGIAHAVVPKGNGLALYIDSQHVMQMLAPGVE